MSYQNPFFARIMDNHRSRITQIRDQENHFYKREEIGLKAQYGAQLEQFKAGEAYRLESMKHGNNLEIEDKRGTIAKWVEEFRGNSAKHLEASRQGGAERLQEREHVHRRVLAELDHAEFKLRSDEAHARDLELTKKTSELATFQKQREAVYALEVLRFSGLIAERNLFTTQLMAEYGIRSSTGQSVISTLSTMLVKNRDDSAKMNEMLLAAKLAKVTRDAEHKQRLEVIQATAEAGKDGNIRAAIDEQIERWNDDDVERGK